LKAPSAGAVGACCAAAITPDIRQYEITRSGIEVQSKFEGREGILSGSPRRMADSFVEAFVRRQDDA
jgi:hypothetical protein